MGLEELGALAKDIEQEDVLWRLTYTKLWETRRQKRKQLCEKHKISEDNLTTLIHKRRSAFVRKERVRKLKEDNKLFAFMVDADKEAPQTPSFIKEYTKLCDLLRPYTKLWKKKQANVATSQQEYKELATKFGKTGECLIKIIRNMRISFFVSQFCRHTRPSNV